MPSTKRPFYIIGHNPNSIADVAVFLKHGANAIGPDIIYRNQQFYVTHNGHLFYKGVPLLEDYLHDLTALLLKHQYPLALIVFDMKDNNYDINLFVQKLQLYFSHEVCKSITILITHPSDTSFLLQYDGTFDNIGIGVDDTNIPAAKIEKNFIAAGQQNFAYADGIIALLNKPRVLSNIHEATVCRALNANDSFKIIFTWVLERSASMRQFLNHYIDGIMVDIPGVKKLLAILQEPVYKEVYTLASKNHNPYKAQPIPTFLLQVTTATKLLAGTNAWIQFTITDVLGNAVTSLPFDAGVKHGFERGKTTFVSIDDANLSTIKSISIKVLKAWPMAAWLPKKITIQSPCRSKTYAFVFEGNDWITASNSPFTKQASTALDINTAA